MTTQAFAFVPAGATTDLVCSNNGCCNGIRQIQKRRHMEKWLLRASSSSRGEMDLQSDESQFGRGDMHLSAMLEEDDLVAYQTGTWMVDGVEVGPGAPPQMNYAKVTNLQLVWTHNCEHGVIRGMALHLEESSSSPDPSHDDDNNDDESIVSLVTPIVDIEFGPEQLVARIPVQWDSDEQRGTILADITTHLLLLYSV
eukprot:scaffold15889_cov71-Attheya_sp.AAC.3